MTNSDEASGRLGVFCGSRNGSEKVFADAAHEFGVEMVRGGFDLVYGGGRVGLMGVLADAVLEAGGHVTGVIPEALAERELAHRSIQDLRVVRTMHERKATVARLSDAFVAMPGGLGTFEELFEMLTWEQLGLHGKPVAILNAGGYYDGLLAFIDHAVSLGFVRPEHREMMIADSTVRGVLAGLNGRRVAGAGSQTGER